MKNPVYSRHVHVTMHKQVQQEQSLTRVLGNGNIPNLFPYSDDAHLDIQCLRTNCCHPIGFGEMGILFLCPKDVDLQCLGTKCFEHLEYTPDSCFFDIPQKMYLVMELCEGGELADALKSQERIPEEECKIIMTRLASAISYLHKNGECCTRTM